MMHVEEGESQLGIPVREIKGIGEKTEKLLAKLDIETVDQLVHHYPRFTRLIQSQFPYQRSRQDKDVRLRQKSLPRFI